MGPLIYQCLAKQIVLLTLFSGGILLHCFVVQQKILIILLIFLILCRYIINARNIKKLLRMGKMGRSCA